MYEIDAGVELPKRSRKSASWKYPLDALDPGESFLVPLEEGEAVPTVMSRLRGACAGAKKRADGSARFTVREVEGGVRVWRIA
jgi:hypothetical protein